MGRAGELRIGTSGWQYDHWRGKLYPQDTPRRRWLELYARRFDTVEVNATFYHLPRHETFDAWRAAAPPGFRYALKLSRYATHLKRLRDPRPPLDAFVERALRLGEHLGPILVQLPPRWRADPGRLAGFLEAAPRALRWAIELRDPSWLCEAVYALLERHGAALCVHDLLPDHPRVRTAGWTYQRFHGPGPRYSGGYSPQRLAAEAARLRRQLAEGVDAWVYFNNDVGGHALEDAARLRRFVLEG